MAGGMNNGQRLDALEHSHSSMHHKLDQLLTAFGGGADLGLVDAQGRPVTAAPNPAPVAAPVQRSPTTDLLAVLAHLQGQQNPRPAPQMDWGPVLVAVAPILIEKLMERPDPIEQLAALKELSDPAMTDQLMAMAMPLVMAKMSGGGAPPAGNPAGGMQDAISAALGSIDPAALAALAAGQAGPNGPDGSA